LGRRKHLITYILLLVLLLGISVMPGQADDTSTSVVKITLDEAIDKAITANPKVRMAEIDKQKKDIAYRDAKNARDRVEDSKNRQGTYQENLARYLNPKIAERQGEQAQKVYEITINGIKISVEQAFYNLIQALF